MVTHYPSSNGSNTSLPLSSPTSPNAHPTYAWSQAGSSTVSRTHRSEPAPPSRFRHDHDNPRHTRSSSVASTSSQSTLQGSYARAPQSVAGYPPAPPSSYSNYSSSSRHRTPSVASTSAARPSSWQRRRSTSRSRADREQSAPRAEVHNEFPWFGQTGDVEIDIRDSRGNHSKRYLLHRLILSQNSAWFSNDLARNQSRNEANGQHGPIANSASQMSASSERRRYELAWEPVREQRNAVPLLTQVRAVQSSGPPATSSRNKPPPPSSNSFFRSFGSSSSNNTAPPPPSPEDEDILEAYDNLFLIFYNHNPRLSTSNIATAYVESKLLLSLASSYSSLSVVGPRIDYHLLRFGSRLWKQIAKYPPSYLKLGHLARSRAIFSEALVHVVGQWPLGQAQLRRGTVDDAVVDLVEDKVDGLETTKLRVEAKLFRINLTTSRGELVSPFNSYIDWLAISLFREWLANNILPDPLCLDAGRSNGTSSSSRTRAEQRDSRASRPQPQTSPRLVASYRALDRGGEAYLDYDEIKRFLKLRPQDYSRENMRRMERRMDELKQLARETVKPLTRNSLELEMGSVEHSAGGGLSPSSYLTCCTVQECDIDYVWKG